MAHLGPRFPEPLQPQQGPNISQPQKELSDTDKILQNIRNASLLVELKPEDTIALLGKIKALRNTEQKPHVGFFKRLFLRLWLREKQPQKNERFREIQPKLPGYLVKCERDVLQLIKDDKISDARAILQALAEVVDDPIPYRRQIADLYIQEERFIQAIDEYNALLQLLPKQQKNTRALCQASLGTCFFKQNQWNEAFEHFMLAFGEDFGNNKAHEGFIEFVVREQFDKKESLQSFNSYLDEVAINVSAGKLALDATYYTKITDFLQGVCDRTGDLEYQKTATQFLQKMGNIFARQQNVGMVAAIATIASQNIRFLPSHPFFHIDSSISERTERMNYSPIGAFFHSLGDNEIKHGIMKAVRKVIDGQPKIVLDFKTTYPTRDKIENWLSLLKGETNPFGSSIEISEEIFTYRKRFEDGTFSDTTDENLPIGGHSQQPNTLAITFPGVGKLLIGSDPEWGALYNRIQVELPADLNEGEALSRLQRMLATIGLPNVLTQQSDVADERIKILQLFRTFFPQQAYDIERDEKCVEMSKESLILFIISKVPDMKSIFDTYLKSDLMQKQEIFPNCPTWHVTDLSEKLKQQGAWGFMAGVHQRNISNAGPSIAFLLRYGLVAGQTRFDAGRIAPGASAIDDHKTGGADCVFTRIITGKLSEQPIDRTRFSGVVQVLFDISLANRCGYAYDDDNFGTRNPLALIGRLKGEEYSKRKNFLETATASDRSSCVNNEYMFKYAVTPDFIKGLVVQKETDKEALVGALREEGISEFNGKPIEECIYIKTHFTREMFV